MQVCEDKSFSNASKNLYITQQGLSKSINKLEETLQLPLFIRSSNGVQLTEYGHYLYENSLPLIKEYELLMQKLDDKVNTHKGHLRIGFSHGIQNALSPDFLHNYREKHKSVKVDVSEHSDLQCTQLIESNDLDIALMIGPIDEDRFHAFSIQKEPMCVLINEENPLSQKESIDFIDLRNERIAIINKDFNTYYNFMNKCVSSGFHPNITDPVVEIMTVHRLSRNNKCIGISAYFVVNEIGSPGCKVIPFNDTSFVWEIFLITKKGMDYNSAKKSFIKYVLER